METWYVAFSAGGRLKARAFRTKSDLNTAEGVDGLARDLAKQEGCPVVITYMRHLRPARPPVNVDALTDQLSHARDIIQAILKRTANEGGPTIDEILRQASDWLARNPA